MLTKHNVYSQKMDVTEVPLQLFHNTWSDFHKHALLCMDKAVRITPVLFSQVFVLKLRLDKHLDKKQKKCLYGSCKIVSRTLPMFRMEVFVNKVSSY